VPDPEARGQKFSSGCFLAAKQLSYAARVYSLEFEKLSFKGDCMKRLFTLVITLFLGATLSVAQAGGGTSGGTTGQTSTDQGTTGKKGHKGGKKGHHKGGKKSKKNTGSTTPPPK
jgi:hypothetical protein